VLSTSLAHFDSNFLFRRNPAPTILGSIGHL
jgi:hypothetical protein